MKREFSMIKLIVMSGFLIYVSIICLIVWTSYATAHNLVTWVTFSNLLRAGLISLFQRSPKLNFVLVFCSAIEFSNFLLSTTMLALYLIAGITRPPYDVYDKAIGFFEFDDLIGIGMSLSIGVFFVFNFWFLIASSFEREHHNLSCIKVWALYNFFLMLFIVNIYMLIWRFGFEVVSCYIFGLLMFARRCIQYSHTGVFKWP